ncbi:proline iminopeptidase [Lysobacter xinjiangensis]|uniref:Proline iminopeptidase n=1 Tax=Cognatilysobacter xinjiangensis TaxID=546892 RepID=A0ABQ3C0Z3_9GAMM|nr:alpha/beta hydrolase [Lysobacter xinjiangensis]GGZ64027.1 proline iminopeptidase [Lysobacter xinjiangensis]
MLRSLCLSLALMLPVSSALAAEPAADPYAQGRALVGDIQRIVTPNGVQETFEVTLGGARQVVNVRGADRDNPILLFVHGGPGAVEMPVAWSFQRPWEDFFTVVQWDQRGAGRSFPLNDPKALAPTLKPERYRDDAIELIEQLRARYGQRKVFVLGHSWGSIVGLMVAMKRPDLLHAYIGMGQVIDFRENERQGYAWVLDRARADGNAEAVKALEALAPYPGEGAFAIDKMSTQRLWSIHYGGLAAGRDNADFYFRAPRLSPEYTPADVKAWGDGSAFTITTMFPQLSDVTFAGVTRLDVPVVMLLGRQDYTTPSSITEAWMARLQAPSKAVVFFEHSAHLPMVEQPGLVLQALVDRVRPLARPR